MRNVYLAISIIRVLNWFEFSGPDCTSDYFKPFRKIRWQIFANRWLFIISVLEMIEVAWIKPISQQHRCHERNVIQLPPKCTRARPPCKLSHAGTD